jgi:hypothetical protein
MSEWNDEYKARMREFMEKHGTKVDVIDKCYSWEENDQANIYGWADFDSLEHFRSAEGKYPGDGCHWVVPEGSKLYERTYNQFQDTFIGIKEEVGINVAGCHCACGKYQDVILRYRGTLADVMQEITGTPKRAEVIL